jgi:hypothetical protein
MLVLKRKEGQWIEIKHKSGDTLRIRVYNIRSRFPAQADLAFEDIPRNFEIQRPERSVRPGPEAAAPEDRARTDPRPPRGVDRPQETAIPAPHPLRPLAHCLMRKSSGPGRTERSS